MKRKLIFTLALLIMIAVLAIPSWKQESTAVAIDYQQACDACNASVEAAFQQCDETFPGDPDCAGRRAEGLGQCQMEFCVYITQQRNKPLLDISAVVPTVTAAGCGETYYHCRSDSIEQELCCLESGNSADYCTNVRWTVFGLCMKDNNCPITIYPVIGDN